MTGFTEIIPETELVLNADGSVYHLNLLPEDIGDIIILVGDPDRVDKVSRHFDEVRLRKQKREFITHTGHLGSHTISVISTGIGTDNIDIVINELDALANIDLKTRRVSPHKKALKLIRIGTCGSLRQDVLPDQIIVSSHAIGLDGLLHYYGYTGYTEYTQLVESQLNYPFIKPYVAAADAFLLNQFKDVFIPGITASCTGFFAPQGRMLRIGGVSGELIHRLNALPPLEGMYMANFEMETSAIFGLAQLMGHQALSINAVIGNRISHVFSKDPYATVEKTIRLSLETIRNM